MEVKLNVRLQFAPTVNDKAKMRNGSIIKTTDYN